MATLQGSTSDVSDWGGVHRFITNSNTTDALAVNSLPGPAQSLYILHNALNLLLAGLSLFSYRNMHPPTSPDPQVHSPAVLELIELRVTDKLTSECIIDAIHERPN